MSPVDCCSPCDSQIAPVVIPGIQGIQGTAGTNGTNGQNAFATTTAQFTTPADLVTTSTVSVTSSVWMVVGETVILGQGPGAILANPGPATYLVTAIASPNTFTGHLINVADENKVISAGAVVSPTGSNANIPVPITIAGGGTNAITKAAAQTNLGLGQDSVISSGAALAQVITNGFVQVGGISAAIPAAGSYEVRGQVNVEMLGVTFVASRTITARIRNTVQGVDVATGILTTQIQATTSFPTHQLQLPPVLYAGGVAADTLQLQIMIDTVNSAGTLSVSAGSVELIPLRKS